jgi:enoyl-CoA hydratase/carnithine racemase
MMETLIELDFMRLEKEGKLGWITFTRTDVLNAVNNAATYQINRIAMALREDPAIRVAVIRGDGRAFCTGIDLKELAQGTIDMTYHRRWERALQIFETMEKLIIVGMHGYCLGGGLQLALACDIRVSTSDCQIGLPAIRESLIPGLGTWRLPRYIGWGRAKKLILGGENINGAEAERIGLVDHLASKDDFFEELDKTAQQYLKACSVGTRMSKLLVNQAFDKGYDAILARYFELQERSQYSLDAQIAGRAYLAGEEPEWQ